MSLLGISFAIGGHDAGAEHAVNNAVKGVERLTDSIDDQNKVVKNSGFRTLMESLRTFTLRNISEQIKDLTGDTGNLMQGMEQFAFSSRQSLQPLLAQMGLFGDEANKAIDRITWMARQTGIDVGTIGESFKALNMIDADLKKTIDSMGMSLLDFVKLQQVSGLATETLVTELGGLKKSWGFNDQELRKFLDDLVGVSQGANLGAAGLSQMQETLSAIDKVFAGLGDSLKVTPGLVAKTDKSIVKLAGAFRKGLGLSVDQAMSQAMDVFQKFGEEAVTAHKVSIGMATDWGELTQALYKVQGSLGGQIDVLKLIKKGAVDPIGAITELSDAFQNAKKAGTITDVALKQLMSTLGDTGDQLYYLITNGGEASKALSDMSKVSDGATGSLKKLATKGFAPMLTVQDRLNLAQENFEYALRRISRKEVRNFVNTQVKGYKQAGKFLSEIADDSLWGGFVRRLSAVNQIGIKGLLIDLDKGRGSVSKFTVGMGIAIDFANNMLNSLQPLSNVLAGFVPLFGQLGFGKLFRGLAGGVGKLAKPLLWILNIGKKVLLFIPNILASIVGWPVTIAAGITAGIAILWKYFPKVKKFISNLGEKIWHWIKVGWSKLVNFGQVLYNWFSNIDWNAVSKSVLISIKQLAVMFENGLKIGWSKLVNFGQMLSNWFSSVDWDAVSESVLSSIKQLIVMFKNGLKIGITKFLKLVGMFGDYLSKIDWGSVMDKISTFGAKLVSMIWKGIKIAWNELVDFTSWLIEVIAGGKNKKNKKTTEQAVGDKMAKIGHKGGMRFLDGMGSALSGIGTWYEDKFIELGKELLMFWRDNVWGPLSNFVKQWFKELGAKLTYWWTTKIMIPVQESWLKLKSYAPWVDNDEIKKQMANLRKLKVEAIKNYAEIIAQSEVVKKHATGMGGAFLDVILETAKIKPELLLTRNLDQAALQRAGFSVAKQFNRGLHSGFDTMDEDMYLIWKEFMDKLPQSPPKDKTSPLVALPDAGAGIMQQLITGMMDELPSFKVSVGKILGNAVSGIPVEPVVKTAVGKNVKVSGALSLEASVRELIAEIKSQGESSRDVLSDILNELKQSNVKGAAVPRVLAS